MNNGTRSNEDRDDNGDLNCLVRGDAQGAIVLGLAVWVGVGDLQDAREQHKSHTDNPDHDDKRLPWPAP